jgi:hypothetical protein
MPEFDAQLLPQFDPAKPHLLDADSYARFVDGVQRGAWLFAGLPGEGAFDAFAAASEAEFEAEFAKQIAQMSDRPDLDVFAVRARAFGNTVIRFRDDAKRLEDETHLIGVPIPRDTLELWAEQRLARLGGSFTKDQLALLSTLMTVSASDFAMLSNVAPATLAVWRSRGIGPSWVQPTKSQGSIMYPLLAIREWLDAKAVNA